MTPPSAYSSPLPGILETPSLNMLAGASGIGKTALISSIARVFHEGDTLFGHAVTRPPAVGYVGADRGGASAIQWFETAGYPDIPTYNIVSDRTFDVAQLRGKFGGPALLAHCIDKLSLPAGSVVFVDPVALFVGANLLDYRAVAIACIEIQRWLHDNPFCVIGVCHTSKLKADEKARYQRPQDRILGTGALLGYTSTQMYLMGPDEAGRDDGRHTFLWNPHHAPEESFALLKGKNGLFDLGQALAPIQEPPSAMALAILQLFPEDGTPISTAQIIQILNTAVEQDPASRMTLHRRLKELERHGLIWSPRKGLWARVIVQ